jgi:putative ABC transport system permease protein
MRELAVRRALGAEGTRIARQLLTESLVLAIAGGVLGVLFARILFDTLLGLGMAELPALGLDLPYLASVGLDARVLALVAAVTVATGLLFGAAPAVLGAGVAPAERLRGGATAARGPAAARLHGALVVAQLALAVTLLGGAGLLLRSYVQLGRVDPGFRPENLTVLRIVPPQRYTDANARAALYERIAERAEAIPGVTATTLINHMPLTRALVVAELRVPGASQTDQPRSVAYRTVAQNFFAVAGVRLIRGRGFVPADFAHGSGAMVVNEVLANALWPDQDPLGRALTVLNPTPGSERFGEPIDGVVVGVVGNTAQPRGADPLPAVYLPHRWEPWGNMNLVLRVERDPAAIVAAVRRAVLEIDDDCQSRT